MFDPSQAGVGTHTITYTYTDNNGCSNSASTSIVVEGCAGIGEHNLSNVAVYPNPMNETLIIANVGKFSYEVVDAQGRLMNMGESNNQVTLDTKMYLSGMYIVRISSNNENYIFKVIKK